VAGVDAQTILLVHCDGADGSSVFTDSSQYAHSLSRTGIKVDTGQSKFGGASAQFQKVTGNSINTPDSTDWVFGSGEFTIDLWVMFSSASGNQCLISQEGSSNAAFHLAFLGGSNKLEFLYYTSGGPHSCAVNWTPSLNTWYHIAVVRSGNTLKLYINGTNTSGGGFDMTGDAIRDSPSSLMIGETSVTPMPLDGWLDEIRISKGVARWTSNFTPPAEAYSPGAAGPYDDHPAGGLVLNGSATSTATGGGGAGGGVDADCVLLLHCDGVDAATTFPDSSPHNHIMTRAGVKVDTSQSKFSGASAQFQGTKGQWIQTGDSPDWDFAAGDWTIDLWVYFASVSVESTLVCQWSQSLGNGAWLLRRTPGTPGRLQLDYRNSAGTQNFVYANWNPSAATWYHIAVVRTGNVVKFFVDGAQLGADSPFAVTLYNSGNSLSIGDYADGGISQHDGWMDEIRISKVARWTANFTPPTAPYSPTVEIVYNDTPAGGLALGGSNTNVQLSDLTEAGGVVLGGAQTLTYVRTSTPSGGIRFGGSVVLGPAKLTVRLLSGGVEIGSWTHVLAGNQARVSWARFQLPLSGAPVIKVVVAKAKLLLTAKPAGTRFRFTLSFRAAPLLLKAKPFDVVDPAHLDLRKPRLRLKGKTYALRQTQRVVVGKSKLILRAKPVARAGQPGLVPTVPKDVTILVPTVPDQEILVPTAAKSTLLTPTAVRGI
jgi:Concanavalin A-like lectin/glucanases superfamily